MIALAGCAKRNADRELARVLAFVEKRIQCERTALTPESFTSQDRVGAVTSALGALYADLAALRHRERSDG